jgi:hypothetical protein
MFAWDAISGYMKHKEARFWLIAVFVTLIVGGSWYGYQAYYTSYEQNAQLAFSTGIQVFARAKNEEANEHLLEGAENLLIDGYNSYSRSAYAPYFLLFASDVALARGNVEQGVQYAERAAAIMPKDAPLAIPMQIRVALQRIDSADIKLREQGLATLQALAGDDKNPYRSMALYFDGLRLFESGNRAEAEKIWQPLIAGNEKNSAWAKLVAAKLAYQL